jgi:peptidoglycan/xylan/chitin deacetylase (PgdA/CDA1 family)
VLPQVARDGIAGTQFYTVQPGDTLYSIARAFDVSVATLVSLNQIVDLDNIAAGAVIMVPLPTPTPLPTATPTALPAGPSTLVEHGSRTSKLVALTLDMGGRPGDAVAIMQWLIASKVEATIFMTGAMAENPNTEAGRDVLALVDAHPELFDLGNHSYSHPDFRTLTAAQMKQELASTEAALAKYTTQSPRPYFRPPFGAWDAKVLEGVGAAGYPLSVMWDVDTIDWLPEADGGPTTSDMVAKVTGNAQGGSIVLMHLGGYNTLEALPLIVSGLRAKGLEPATLSDVLAQ